MPQENYILGDVIGKGSYGEVTLARHKRDKKQYVIKKIDFHNASPKERLYAQQEVNILSKLKHPNIVSYKESFQTSDGAISIVMGYCELGDLYCHLKKQSKLGEYLSETKLVEWFVQISMALQYMHDRHILHRDLKTQNIFLTKSRIIKIGDLGIARVLENNFDMATTMIGTPYYMSPELFSNKPYNHKSDVWALGCCLYEMATLKHAFNARDMNSLVYKILKGKTPDMPSNYSSELRNIIKSMLNYDPELRPSAASILRLPYIKKQIAIFLEGTKNRRLIREEKKPSKENNISSDSGFSEISGDDPQCIATASEVQINVCDEESSVDVVKEKAQGHNDQCNKDSKTNQSNKKEVKKNLPKEKRRDEVAVRCDDPSGNLDNVRHNRKENSRPSDVRKILSDRIQAKARLKRRELEEKQVSKENKSMPADIKCSNGHTPELACLNNKKDKAKSELLIKPIEKPRRELPVLPSHDSKVSELPPFRCSNSNVNKETKTKVIPKDEATPVISVGVPNLSARKKRRLRQQQSDSSINTSPTHSNIKGNANSFVSYQSYIPRPKEEIIKEHLSRVSSNVCERDSIDGLPEAKVSASPGTTISGAEDPMTASGGSDKVGHDVSSLIDTLQATLTMVKSKEHKVPEVCDLYDDTDSDTLTPSSPSAAGRLRHRIELLRKECIDGIGELMLNEAYEIINKQSEDDVEKSLIHLLGKSKFEEFGGPIWQLKFCEEF